MQLIYQHLASNIFLRLKQISILNIGKILKMYKFLFTKKYRKIKLLCIAHFTLHCIDAENLYPLFYI